MPVKVSTAMRLKFSVPLFILMITGFASCKNNADVYPIPLTTALNVVNATADTLNFYLNGTRINNTSNLYPAGATGYLSVTTLGLKKIENYQFKKPATTAVILNTALQLDSNKAYSLFVAGIGASQAFAIRDTILANDTTTSVRFVNASVDAGSVDVQVGTAYKFVNRPYKSVTVFTQVGSGIKLISVYKSGTTILLYSLPVTLQLEDKYTIFSQGSITGAGSRAFSVATMVN